MRRIYELEQKSAVSRWVPLVTYLLIWDMDFAIAHLHDDLKIKSLCVYGVGIVYDSLPK